MNESDTKAAVITMHHMHQLKVKLRQVGHSDKKKFSCGFPILLS